MNLNWNGSFISSIREIPFHFSSSLFKALFVNLNAKDSLIYFQFCFVLPLLVFLISYPFYQRTSGSFLVPFHRKVWIIGGKIIKEKILCWEGAAAVCTHTWYKNGMMNEFCSVCLIDENKSSFEYFFRLGSY